MPKVTVSISKFDGNKFVREQIASIKILSKRHLEAVAKETERVIREKITERIDKREGSTGNLANSFYALKISDGWGVGSIPYLNQNAKYWYWQNYGKAQSGRTIPPRSRGQFRNGNPAPSPAGGNSRWEQSSTGKYLIDPKRAIEAKNYIEATINEINQIVSNVIRTIK